MSSPHVVIVGAGFAGLHAARRLEQAAGDRPLEVTVVDRHNYHTFQPLLYQVATAGLNPQDVGHSVRGIFGRRGRVGFRMQTVRGVDLDGHTLELDDGERLAYDHLVVATGAVTADYGIPGVSDHAFALKSIAEAVTLRNHLLRTFEHVERDPSLIDRGALTFVVAGAGPTGVELAGSLAELIERVVARDHPRVELHRVRIVLVEMLDEVLPPYTASSQRATRRALEERGVEVRTGTAIQRVQHDRVVLQVGEDGPTEELLTGTVVWTAGVQANPLGAALGVEPARGGRIPVAADLSLPDRPEVWVVGDLAGPVGDDDAALPQLAPVAIQQGQHAAEQLLRRLDGRPTEPFRYRDRGTMATIGRGDAVAELVGGIKLRGFLAWVAWLGLHLLQLVGFRNRASVLLNWAWNYLTYDRGPRLIVEPHEPAVDEVVRSEVVRRSA